MGKFLQFKSSFNSINPQISDQSQSDFHSSSNSDSSSNSSLASQSSLPSVPSLTLPPPAAAAAAVHHHCSATIKSTSSSVFSLALAGKHLYSGDADGKLTAYSNYDSTPAATTSAAVKSIVISGDGRIFTAHQDHKIRVWRIDQTNSSANQKKHKLVTILPTLPDRCSRIFSAGNYVEIRRHKKRTWVHHVDAVSSLAVTSDSSLLYSASWDRSFKIWRTKDHKCVESVRHAHDDAINAVVLSGDGFVYTGSADKRIRVWKIGENNKHTLISTLEKHKSAVNALALSNDGSILYSGACDRSIIVWERDGGGGGGHMAVAGALRGHTKAILCLAVVDGLLFSGSADKTVRVWRRGCGNSYFCVAVLEGHGNAVKCLTACLDGGEKDGNGDWYLVYSGSLDCEIKVWRVWVPFGDKSFTS